MNYTICQKTITVFIENPDRQKAHEVDLSSLRILTRQSAAAILDATSKTIRGMRYTTQLGHLRTAVGPFGRYLGARAMGGLPQDIQSWQHLIIDFHAWYLSNKDSRAALVSRARQWDQCVAPWLAAMMNEGVAPRGLMVPRTKLRKELTTHGPANRSKIIGIRGAVPERHLVGGTIGGNLFWEPDEAALDGLHTILKKKIGHLDVILDDYWLRLVKDYRSGIRLTRTVPTDLLARCELTGNWRAGANGVASGRLSNRLITHPSVPGSEAAVLSIMKKILEHSSDPCCMSMEELKKHPAFYVRFGSKESETPTRELVALTSLRSDQVCLQTRLNLYQRFLGVLNPLDFAVAAAILIREHPNFNPLSILHALLDGPTGNRHLVLYGQNGQIFSVDKPRAGTRKYAVLSKRARRILRHLLRCTDPIRAMLRRADSKFASHLFLGAAKGQLGHPEITAKQLNGQTKYSLIRYYRELVTDGFGPGTLDFSKIRSTVGVLVWFETGSIALAARKLGNTQRITLQHYIPAEVRKFWNERTVRRFQNIVIALSSSTENLIKATDLPSEDALKIFLHHIIDSLGEGSSVFAKHIHGRFGGGSPQEDSPQVDSLSETPLCDLYKQKGTFAVSLEPRVLAKLYQLGAEHELGPAHEEDVVGLLALSRLLAILATSDDGSDVQLMVANIGALRVSHNAAIEILRADGVTDRVLQLILSWSAR